jgi:hypothetical protein
MTKKVVIKLSEMAGISEGDDDRPDTDEIRLR